MIKVELKFLEKVKVLENVRSGFIYTHVGKLWTPSTGGDYWSSKSWPDDVSYACNLGYNTADIIPSQNSFRSYAFPLRCLAD